MIIIALIVGALISYSTADGDQAFASMKYDEAVTIYESLLSRDSTESEVFWRLARVHVCMGDVQEGKEREIHYRRALYFARRCVTVDSQSSAGYTWLAAALGNTAMFEGSRTKVAYCREIKRLLDIAIVLDPKNDVAYSILGSFYRQLANVNWLERSLADLLMGGLPQGGRKESEDALTKAIAIAPNIIRHRYELGLLYKEWSKDDQARETFEVARQLQPSMVSDYKRLAQIEEWTASR